MLRNKTFTKILSVGIAITLWAYVITVLNPTGTEKIANVPVHILNEENLTQRGLTLVGDLNFYVTVPVEGRRAEISDLKAEDILAQVDVFGRTAGLGQSVTVEVTLPEDIKAVSGKTQRIILDIEELVAVHKPINVQITGEFEKNTEPGEITIQPEEIEVKGAKSLVESVSYVAAQVDAGLITEEGTVMSVEVMPTNVKGEPVEDVKLSSNTVDITAKLCYTKEVPLTVEIIGEVGKEYELTGMNIPQTVVIRGAKDAIGQITEVTATDVDLSHVTATSKLPLKLDLPEGIELANASKNIGIAVTIKGIVTGQLEFPPSQIKVQGLENGKTAYINTDAVKLAVTGDETLIGGMVADDFSLWVDVSGLDAGSHAVSLKVESQKPFASIAVVPEDIYITINEAT